MLCQYDNLETILSILHGQDIIALDTETYGLGRNDKPFSIQMACSEGAFYFNFNNYNDGTPTIDPIFFASRAESLFADTTKTWVIHNATFDINKLLLLDIVLAGNIVCTGQLARIQRNDHMSYSLDSCLKRLGRQKDDSVSTYIKEHKLWTVNAKGDKNLHYDRVPFELMYAYGLTDVKETLYLYDYLMGSINQRLSTGELRPLNELIENEGRLAKAMADVMFNGVRINKDRIPGLIATHTQTIATIEAEISSLAGRKFQNGPKFLEEVCKQQGIAYETSEKGNPKFNKEFLKQAETPVTSAIKQFRDAQKTMEFLVDMEINTRESEYIYPSFGLFHTVTARFSSFSPNAQQIPKEDKFGISIRELIIPDAKSDMIVAMDFDQMEYRVLVDYSGDKQMANKIMEGQDIHQVTADVLGITRKQAKTFNFGKLYGMGQQKIADSLGVSLIEAKKIRRDYDNRFSTIADFTDQVMMTAKSRGFIFNKYNRPLCCERGFEYRMVNHLIQGSCADLVRRVIVKIHELLKNTGSRLIMQVHDELVFNISQIEAHELIPKIKEIMENEYVPLFTNIKLTCGIEYSYDSWNPNKMTELNNKENL